MSDDPIQNINRIYVLCVVYMGISISNTVGLKSYRLVTVFGIRETCVLVLCAHCIPVDNLYLLFDG